MIKFPSISQFRNVVRHVQQQSRFAGKDENGDAIYDTSRELPTLEFRGTVKLHGTNAGIVYDVKTGAFEFQSRERVLAIGNDNAGFALAMSNTDDVLEFIMASIYTQFGRGETNLSKIAVFGEWCGAGIQKGVAVSALPKMFVIFAAKLIREEGFEDSWVDVNKCYEISHPAYKIYSIFDFPTYVVNIDFSRPELAQNEMIALTEEVEAECPVGAAFDEFGIGEGVVWTCVTPGWNDSGTWFKVKGEKHSTSKVRTLASVDVEAVATMHEFVDNVVTEARLEQGLDNLVREQQKPFEMTSMGDFIRWVFNDIMKEELDVIVASQIDPKKIGGLVANKARPWFVKRLNS